MSKIDHDDCIPTPEEQAEHYDKWMNTFLDEAISLGSFQFEEETFYAFIQCNSYIPDLYVFCIDYIWDQELYDNKSFQQKLFTYLKSTGYKGQAFGRCELGMQGPNHVAFEPNEAFEEWATQLGWINPESSENLS